MRIRLTNYAMRNLLEDGARYSRLGKAQAEPGRGNIKLESLILAQNERWRQA
jgi:hypothetical protein